MLFTIPSTILLLFAARVAGRPTLHNADHNVARHSSKDLHVAHVIPGVLTAVGDHTLIHHAGVDPDTHEPKLALRDLAHQVREGHREASAAHYLAATQSLSASHAHDAVAQGHYAAGRTHDGDRSRDKAHGFRQDHQYHMQSAAAHRDDHNTPIPHGPNHDHLSRIAVDRAASSRLRALAAHDRATDSMANAHLPKHHADNEKRRQTHTRAANAHNAAANAHFGAAQAHGHASAAHAAAGRHNESQVSMAAANRHHASGNQHLAQAARHHAVATGLHVPPGIQHHDQVKADVAAARHSVKAARVSITSANHSRTRA